MDESLNVTLSLVVILIALQVEYEGSLPLQRVDKIQGALIAPLIYGTVIIM